MADFQRSSCTTFLCTQKGMLLFAEIILCLVILTLYGVSTSGYISLSLIELILAIIFFIIYTCDLHTKIQFIHWPWTDFFRAAIIYLITSIIVLVERGYRSRIVAGVLGLIATALFGYDASITCPMRQ
ncbi:Proteolipid protein 2 [Bos mutus]|uniref:Proteolipid protein 2 n=1 Tax=Bos mutus TaxID=72004 RepID=L8IF24_9CETA|nr:PREDICTED: proteolipid protein 2 [Bos mutus]ELR54144.1 Proteolipid protein 2 [Bos mutus]